LEGLARPSNAERAGQRILGAMAAEFKLGTAKLRMTACLGIALGRTPADGPDLVPRARAALHDQRRSGQQGIRLAPTSGT